jgi:serine phosphatase RsbU (regulator of sigma subunit)
MRVYAVLILLILSTIGFAQRVNNHLILDGTVLGYTHDDSKSIFKKDKKIELEGSLSSVQLKLKNSKGELIESIQTSNNGKFRFKIPIGDIYTIVYSKSGYGTSAIDINLKFLSSELEEWGLVLKNIELILNNYESDKPQDNGESFGVIRYNNSKSGFEFKAHEFPQKNRLFKKDEENTSVSLIELSLDKNKEANILSNKVDSPVSHNKSGQIREAEITNENEDVSGNYNDAENKMSAASRIVVDNSKITKQDIEMLGNQLEAERALLELDRSNAVTEIDFLNISAREKLLENAELELANAERYINEQEHKLEAQQNFILAAIGVLLLFAILSVVLWLAFRQKKKSGAMLASKNKKIQDSINYALKIQRSVLLSDAQIKAILPKSFVYYQPLDSVSGDFYWFSKIENKTILAAVDCTGHGVPGAFMSLIGNTLMNQIVNQDGVLSPSEILKRLHAGIVQSLQQTENDDAAQDGMDISVCCIDHDAGKLVMAGAMNSVYLFQKGEIKTLRADLVTIGGYTRKGRPVKFSEQSVEVNVGDRIYLFSDGFMDQFGGEKDEKYNISRFKKLIEELAEEPMDKQEDAFKTAHVNWKKSTLQTDDILVIGAEI